MDTTTYLAEIRPLIEPASAYAYTQRLRRWSKWIGARKVTSELCAEWINHLISLGLSRRTVKQYCSTLKSYLDWMEERGHLTEVPRINTKRLSVTATERRVFTLEEYERLLLDVSEMWRYGIMVGWETGLRLGDVACLKWIDVSFETASIKVMPKKTRRFGKQVEIPFSPTLLAVLTVMRATTRPDEMHVCPEMAAHYLTDQHRSLSGQFGRLLAKAGIKGRSYHCLRHSAITRWIAGGATVEAVASMTGQSYQQILGYTHLSLDDKRKVCGL